jgi:hypothetical protein
MCEYTGKPPGNALVNWMNFFIIYSDCVAGSVNIFKEYTPVDAVVKKWCFTQHIRRLRRRMHCVFKEIHK